MNNNKIVTADLHFDTDPLTEYRWNIYHVLKDAILKYNAQELIILGDLTEKKDNHGSILVNRVVNLFTKLSDLCKVTILKGNHDYIDENKPFFSFLSEIDNVTFVSEPTKIDYAFFIPHSKNFFPDIPDGVEEVYLHHTFSGAYSNAGAFALKGMEIPESLMDMSKIKVIFSGDVHKAQLVKFIRYVGAPYHIDFGDRYNGSITLLKNNNGVRRVSSLPTYDKFPSRFSWTIHSDKIKNLSVSRFKHDQAKVTILVDEFSTSTFAEEKALLKEICDKADITLVSVNVLRKNHSVKYEDGSRIVETPEESYNRYTTAENILDGLTLNLGRQIIL